MPTLRMPRYTIDQAARAAGVSTHKMIADYQSGRVETSGLHNSVGRRTTTFLTQAQLAKYRAKIANEKKAARDAAAAKAAAERREADSARFVESAGRVNRILADNGLKIEGRLVSIDGGGS